MPALPHTRRSQCMKWQVGLLSLLCAGSAAMAQQLPLTTLNTNAPAAVPSALIEPAPNDGGSAFNCCQQDDGNGFLTGNHNFANFIGFMGNPLMAIDPRAKTDMYPIFDSVWVKSFPALPSGNIQLYGAGLDVAVSDRLSFGLNQGGYAVANFQRRTFDPFLTNLLTRLDRDRGGDRDGWLNLGGYGQYTLIQDVPDQFLLTAGLRWEAPCGSSEIFQGHGPAHLAPYVTVGKEFFCDYHVLATAGYEFPTGSGDITTDLFYGTVHLDKRCFGWFYPLVEFNWICHTTSVNLNTPNLPDFFDFSGFAGTGNIVSLAAGFNAVIVPEKVEFGGAYTTSIAAQNGFSFNGILLKLTLRY
jgi:hypothetical protein